MRLLDFIFVWVLSVFGAERRCAMETGLLVRLDDLGDVPCRELYVTCRGMKYRLTNEYNGLLVHGISNCLLIRPVVANQVFIDQVGMFAEKPLGYTTDRGEPIDEKDDETTEDRSGQGKGDVA